MAKRRNLFYVSLTIILFCVGLLGMDMTAQAAGLNYSKKNILVGETFTVTLTKPKDQVTYSSSDTKIARVNKQGLVTGVNKGTAVITVRVGRKKYECKVTVTNQVDLIVFAGQSNMTGQGGSPNLAPVLTDGAGYECKTITDPDELAPIQEPFGKGQDTALMNDSPYRFGTLVTPFVNAYYKQTNVPVVGVSCTKVGTPVAAWNSTYSSEIISRYKVARAALRKKGIKIRHRYLVFLQGECEALEGIATDYYKDNLLQMFDKVEKKTGIEKCLMIRIGSYHRNKQLFDRIVEVQTKISRNYKDFVLVSTKAATLSARYYRDDGLHLNQSGLNVIGTEAGKYAGKYATSGKEPTLNDRKSGNTYKARKIQK